MCSPVDDLHMGTRVTLRLTLGTKLFVAITLLVAGGVATVSFAAYEIASERHAESVLEELKHTASVIVSQLDQQCEDLLYSAASLAESTAVRSYVQGGDSADPGAVFGEIERGLTHRPHFLEILLTMSRTGHALGAHRDAPYGAARRIDRHVSTRPASAPRRSMTAEDHSSQSTLQMKAGPDNRAILHASSPVVVGGQTLGEIFIEVDIGLLLGRLAIHLAPERSIHAIQADPQVHIHMDREAGLRVRSDLQFGEKFLPRITTAFPDHPTAWIQARGPAAGAVVARPFGPANDKRPWLLLLTAPRRQVEAQVTALANRLFTVTATIVSLGLLISWPLVRMATRPMRQLADSLTRQFPEVLSSGERPNSADAGELNAAFDRMLAQVDERQSQLAEEMRLRSRTERELLATLEQIGARNVELSARAEELAAQRRDALRLMQEACSAKQAAENAELSEKRVNQQLMRRNEELEQFNYVASHDLQEPLRKIQAFSQLLIDRFSTDLADEARDYLQRMGRAATRMRALIDDLLLYSRAGRGSWTATAIELEPLAKEVLESLAPLIRRSNAQVSVGEMAVVEGESRQLRQLLHNLISNALKFQTPDTAPQVRVSAKRLLNRESDLPLPGDTELPVCQLEVADNGIGFHPCYAERIFQPFRRLHARNEFDGSGVGLALSRRIVERHGGRIEGFGEPGRGAKFIVVLPCTSPFAHAEPPEGADPTPAPEPRIETDSSTTASQEVSA